VIIIGPLTAHCARWRVVRNQSEEACELFRFYAELGGLLSYGVDMMDNFRRSAAYVDKVLKGTKPRELPVQAPYKFELVINLKTAKALGLEVPLQLRLRADDLIE
jgi:putative tryptophan/tyrosine transport system substrate-binding protein